MTTALMTKNLSHHMTELRELRDKTNRLEKVLHSTNYMRHDFVNEMAPVLQELTLRSTKIRHDIFDFQLESLEILTSESISQVEKSVQETKAAIIHILGDQSKNRYNQVKSKLCRLLVAIDELQEVLYRTNRIFIKKCLVRENSKKTVRFKIEESNILRSLN